MVNQPDKSQVLNEVSRQHAETGAIPIANPQIGSEQENAADKKGQLRQRRQARAPGNEQADDGDRSGD